MIECLNLKDSNLPIDRVVFIPLDQLSPAFPIHGLLENLKNVSSSHPTP